MLLNCPCEFICVNKVPIIVLLFSYFNVYYTVIKGLQKLKEILLPYIYILKYSLQISFLKASQCGLVMFLSQDNQHLLKDWSRFFNKWESENQRKMNHQSSAQHLRYGTEWRGSDFWRQTSSYTPYFLSDKMQSPTWMSPVPCGVAKVETNLYSALSGIIRSFSKGSKKM